ncbi:hypothetical protein PENANT_c006G03196 [Penicillium antarcticum]|uniref:Uncharacterized protein n=1 Tax=Penicillium antarcticum TaxID=416450 RepID=A0A1V6QCV6_9EURO|nr:hypothetical protein PENANT_c006G03196 [Penicillium antarcticum]
MLFKSSTARVKYLLYTAPWEETALDGSKGLRSFEYWCGGSGKGDDGDKD